MALCDLRTPHMASAHADAQMIDSNAPPAVLMNDDPADAALTLMSIFGVPPASEPTSATCSSTDEDHTQQIDDSVQSVCPPTTSQGKPAERSLSTDTVSTMDLMDNVSADATPAEIAALAATGLTAPGSKPPTGRRQSKRDCSRRPSRLLDGDDEAEMLEKEPRRHWSGVARGPAPLSAGGSEVERETERRLRMNHLRRCNEDMRILMLGWSSIEVREPGKVPHFVYEHPTLGRARSKKEIFRLHKGEKLNFNSDVASVVSERVRQLRSEVGPQNAVPDCYKDTYRSREQQQGRRGTATRPGAPEYQDAPQPTMSDSVPDLVAPHADAESATAAPHAGAVGASETAAHGLTASAAATASVRVGRGGRRACVRPTSAPLPPSADDADAADVERSVTSGAIKQINYVRGPAPLNPPVPLSLPAGFSPPPAVGPDERASSRGPSSSRSSSSLGGCASTSPAPPAVWRSLSLDAMVAAAALANDGNNGSRSPNEEIQAAGATVRGAVDEHAVAETAVAQAAHTDEVSASVPAALTGRLCGTAAPEAEDGGADGHQATDVPAAAAIEAAGTRFQRPVACYPTTAPLPPPLPTSQRTNSSTLCFSRLPPAVEAPASAAWSAGAKRAREDGGVDGAEGEPSETSPHTCGKRVLTSAKRWL